MSQDTKWLPDGAMYRAPPERPGLRPWWSKQMVRSSRRGPGFGCGGQGMRTPLLQERHGLRPRCQATRLGRGWQCDAHQLNLVGSSMSPSNAECGKGRLCLLSSTCSRGSVLSLRPGYVAQLCVRRIGTLQERGTMGWLL